MKKVKRIKKVCENCKASFEVRETCTDSNRFCSRKCYWENLVNQTPWNKGKKATEEAIKNQSKAHVGLQRGIKHPNWKGGLTPVVMSIRNSFRYRQWRNDVFTRDNFTCQLCQTRSGMGKKVYIEADHFPILFSEIFHDNQIMSLEEAYSCEELWDINNGRTLCLECHQKHGRKK